ncbi:DNA glycosylase [Ascobolus immersus RN42]|uniref:N-glycosylase/DNA lyase n=1 Tax=Ascobolus immersus RN42 TaxID=1160509 RepID=A0A3N4IQ18_ASCIM|nr:DNA glycosylase [Ascobolus immersus RN42]
MSAWKKFPVELSELCIDTVLRCGQSFRWKKTGETWSCALKGRVLLLQQEPDHLRYREIFPEAPVEAQGSGTSTIDLLNDYFNLSTDLKSLYKQWSDRDPHFSKKAITFTGIRMLRQDPWENLISFICSSNNNISRIGQMVGNLCIHYGPRIAEVDGTVYHDFPAPEKLAVKGVEETLRKLGFGYRAKYIAQTANMVVNELPEGWLMGLREKPYREAHDALLQLSGVGPKVADCICLMSLDKTEAVPVDTHVMQIATRDYKFNKIKSKSMTKALYDAVGDHFRELWGPGAGWAHSVLFTADLKSFADKEVGVVSKTTKKSKSTTVKKEVVEGESVIKAEEVTVKREANLNSSVKDEIKEDPWSDDQSSSSRKRKIETATVDALETTVVRRRLRSGRER